jgi:hypothetical protein
LKSEDLKIGYDKQRMKRMHARLERLNPERETECKQDMDMPNLHTFHADTLFLTRVKIAMFWASFLRHIWSEMLMLQSGTCSTTPAPAQHHHTTSAAPPQHQHSATALGWPRTKLWRAAGVYYS